MNPNLFALAAAMLALIAAGCITNPKTKLRVKHSEQANGTNIETKVKLDSPKDAQLAGITGDLKTGTFKIGSADYLMNPEIPRITTAGTLGLSSTWSSTLQKFGEMALAYFMANPQALGNLTTPSSSTPQGALYPPPQLATSANVLWLPAVDLHTTPPIPAGWRIADNFYGVFCLSGNTNLCFIAIQKQ